MPTTTTRKLRISSIQQVTTAAEMTRKGKRYSHQGYYHFTHLWVSGQEHTGKATCTDIYPFIRRFWGLLSAKRLEALHRTAPDLLTLNKRELEDEVAEWIEAAKRWHAQAGSGWEATADRRYESSDFSNRRLNVWPEPAFTAPPQAKLKQQNCHTRKGRCQICDELKPRAGMKGYRREFKRICRDCRRTLGL